MSNKPYIRLDKDNAAVLLVDHQTGLLSLVRDIDPDKFKNNVLALADMAEYFKLPTILTTSFENGPNGPLVPELKEKFPTAPYIARPGQINAWDNEDFVKAVKATGKKQLIVAGVVTEVCVAFPVLSALAEGFEVFDGIFILCHVVVGNACQIVGHVCSVSAALRDFDESREFAFTLERLVIDGVDLCLLFVAELLYESCNGVAGGGFGNHSLGLERLNEH